MVQDPNFWRRFSVAVHNDEAAILAKDLESSSGGGTRNQETKHAYVVSLSSPIDSPTSAISSTPNSTSHLSPAFPPAGFHAPPKMPAVTFARPLSAPTLALARGDTSPCSGREREQQRKSLAAGSGGRRSVMFASEDKPFETVIALHKLPSQPQPTHTPSTPKSLTFNLSATPSLSNPSPSSKRSSRRTSRFRFPRPTKSLPLRSHPPTQPSTPLSASFAGSKTSLPIPSSTHRASWRWSRLKQPNGSRLSLGVSLSGRPKSAFRFWTTITADAGNDRDSWLEGQQRKAKHRTYMCWAFWMTFLVVVVGGVVAVLVLKGKGII